MNITEQQKKTLLLLARITIADKLGISWSYTKGDLDLRDPLYTQTCGAFVTLHKHGALRGCIGYITGIKELAAAIEDMAVAAAFKDPRFHPVQKDEFEQIDIEISVLSPITQISTIDEIEVGRDGLIISNGSRSGLLLPQVPVEQGWDRAAFLEHTCLKAGLPPDMWKDSSTTIEKFTATVFGERT